MPPVLNTVDKRIAAALQSPEHDPADLAALITEVEQTIGSVTAEMTLARFGRRSFTSWPKQA
jgi:hypothetical protein